MHRQASLADTSRITQKQHNYAVGCFNCKFLTHLSVSIANFSIVRFSIKTILHLPPQSCFAVPKLRWCHQAKLSEVGWASLPDPFVGFTWTDRLSTTCPRNSTYKKISRTHLRLVVLVVVLQTYFKHTTYVLQGPSRAQILMIRNAFPLRSTSIFAPLLEDTA